MTSLEHVREISQLSLLADVLPQRVGSLLSIANLRQDLSVAFETADKWVGILENLYYCFRIMPYALPHLRAIKKERKLYLWDWSLCDDEASRFENLVASHLLKYCHYVEDTEGDDMSLRFLRDSSGREIDFVVLKNGKPEFAVECKSGARELGRNIAYFSQRTPIPRYYQVHVDSGRGAAEYLDGKATIVAFPKFCELYAI